MRRKIIYDAKTDIVDCWISEEDIEDFKCTSKPAEDLYTCQMYKEKKMWCELHYAEDDERYMTPPIEVSPDITEIEHATMVETVWSASGLKVVFSFDPFTKCQVSKTEDGKDLLECSLV